MNETSMSRRAMLRTAAGAAVVAGAAVAMPGTAGARESHGALRVPHDRISIQLYTLRAELEADTDATLGALADIGYRSVELAGTYGLSAKEFRALLDKHHLRATSAHVDFNGADVNQLIEDAKVLGYSTADCAGAQYETLDEWTDFARRLDEAGAAFRKAGISYGYHNHDHEWAEVEGTRPLDVIVRNTQRCNVHLEYDLYWLIIAGADPVAEYYRNFGRVTQFHVKDRAPDGGFANPGEGDIDFPSLFRKTWPGPMKDYIVENDEPVDALETAKVGYEYLHDLRF